MSFRPKPGDSLANARLRGGTCFSLARGNWPLSAHPSRAAA